jgi:NAD(P)-dependent dehydrogenase (short-subunit alcohol dehydrogenase family)
VVKAGVVSDNSTSAVLLTGATGGIGEAAARVFVAHVDTLVVHGPQVRVADAARRWHGKQPSWSPARCRASRR